MNLRAEKMSENIEKELMDCFDPATGKVIGRVPVNTIEDISQAVRLASTAQKEWTLVPIAERRKIIRKVRSNIYTNADLIARTISADNGKTINDAMATEVLPAMMAADYYARRAPAFLKDRSTGTGNLFFLYKRGKITRVPFGVVGIISPWNYPFAIPVSEIIMGLLAGNAIIFKAASETQLVGEKIKEVFENSGLTKGVFQYINIPGRIAGDTFLESGINKLFFTGSVAVGKKLMAKAAETLTPLCLELGGNDPMIVCEDADLERAASGALWAGFSNGGQSCGGVERIYVDAEVYDQFLGIMKERLNSFRVGNGVSYNSDMGCITTRKQKETVNAHITEAIEKGAKVFASSSVPEDSEDGLFMPAVLMTEVDHSMILMQEETFGPVIGVMKYNEINEAIRLANDSNLGLTASVWSKNRRKAVKIAHQINAGAVTINDHLMSHGLAETPWGGFKESSIGRTHGELGFAEMTQPKVIVNDFMPFLRKNLWWHPYSEKLYRGIKGIGSLLYAPQLRQKFAGAQDVISILFRMFRK